MADSGTHAGPNPQLPEPGQGGSTRGCSGRLAPGPRYGSSKTETVAKTRCKVSVSNEKTVEGLFTRRAANACSRLLAAVSTVARVRALWRRPAVAAEQRTGAGTEAADVDAGRPRPRRGRAARRGVVRAGVSGVGLRWRRRGVTARPPPEPASVGPGACRSAALGGQSRRGAAGRCHLGADARRLCWRLPGTPSPRQPGGSPLGWRRRRGPLMCRVLGYEVLPLPAAFVMLQLSVVQSCKHLKG
ncbi:uncharacterized protein LOC116073668 [Mastomys coucha]|uniref:uncharacterized protein LOC116073668 n=1 Tax=Mastomys coucha TaxID=35658 RepID=UPI001261E750|nr:uncharacterized protein LOC116073668 [Mastomys coucha]